MIWRKEFGYNHLKNLDYLLAVIIILIAVGFFYRQPFLYAVIGIFSTYLFINKLYDRLLGKKLMLTNEQTTLRLFQGEEDTLTFTLQNRSIFPMVNGQFKFISDPEIQALDHSTLTDKYRHELKIPLSIMGKGQTKVVVEIRAEQRGVARINHLSYTFPHLFNFDLVTLLYSSHYLTEVIVFPKPLEVQGIEVAFQITPGLHRVNLSPFEDVQSPLGTREYSYNDPFHRINWKASVKTQGLQTNEYEKIIDMSYVFIVNIGTKNDLHMARFNENLEDLLSYTAYLCQYATKKGMPYEVYINARKPGKIPYIHLPAGEGKSHYGLTLEMLARIQRQSMVVTFHQMIYQVGQHLMTRKTVIILGEITDESSQMIQHWKQKQHHIFHIKTIGDVAIVEQWGMRDAK